MFGNIGFFEIFILCFLGLLIFGKRLPEVGKNLGKSIVEFKKGISGVEEEANKAAQAKQVETQYAKAEATNPYADQRLIPSQPPASGPTDLEQAQRRIKELEAQAAAKSGNQPSA